MVKEFTGEVIDNSTIRAIDEIRTVVERTDQLTEEEKDRVAKALTAEPPVLAEVNKLRSKLLPNLTPKEAISLVVSLGASRYTAAGNHDYLELIRSLEPIYRRQPNS